MSLSTGARRRVARSIVALPVALAVTACWGDDEPTGPRTVDVEVLVSGGDGQFASPGETLARPLEVHVQSRDDHQPREGVTVEWTVVEGRGASLSAASSTTNSQGNARSRLTLGSALGLYRVRAEVSGAPGEPPEFWARAVERPVLTEVPGGAVAQGDTVLLRGRNFIPEVDEVVVTFAGIRGAAVEGDAGSLRVRVPPCLPSRSAAVRVALGGLESEPRTVRVEGDATAVDLAPGEALTVVDPAALSCVRLPRSSSARYLAAVVATSTLGAAEFDYELLLRGGGAGAPIVDGGETSPATAAVRDGRGRALRDDRGRAGGRAQTAWDATLRQREARALEADPVPARPSRVPGPATVPSPGEERTFRVLNGEGGFDDVTATVRFVGERSVVYVDRRAPEPGFDSLDLKALGGEFDDPIHPTVTGVFGRESDLDGNDRVVVLFTPTVNELTEPGDDGFVGGFFYGVDLLEDREGSNGGEVFYALVPDSAGEFGEPRSRSRVLSVVPAILAHEFQHMVHFNQRVLRLGAGTTDALWLSEALATSAEDLVADAFAARGMDERSWTFRQGNYIRAHGFLEDPSGVSLVVSAGSGSLEERGAGWLFLRYLRGRTGGDEVLGGLTRSTRTGTANVESETGVEWPVLTSDWAAALYLDGLDVPVAPVLTFRDFELREEISRVGEGFPLTPPVLGGGDVDRARSLRASSVDHVVVDPEAAGGIALNLAGPGGGPTDARAGLRLRLVRVH